MLVDLVEQTLQDYDRSVKVEKTRNVEGDNCSVCIGTLDGWNDPPTHVHLCTNPVGNGSGLLGPMLETT